MIEELKNNIEIEIKITKELADFVDMAEHTGYPEKKIFVDMINSLIRKIKIINKSTPELLRDISYARNLPGNTTPERKVETLSLQNMPLRDSPSAQVVLNKSDKKEFLETLNISEHLLRKIMKKSKIKEKKADIFRKPSIYGKLSNRMFLRKAENLIKNGNFKSLSLNIKRSDLGILTTTYISMMFFTVFLSIIIAFMAYILVVLFDFSLSSPFIELGQNYLSTMMKMSWILVFIPLLTAVAFYFYPGTEKKSISRRIEQELPFVVIHMGSISGSGIEPIEIFKIIALSKEYKYTGKEMKKILNQTNVYGYDLTTSLRNISRSSPSIKLSELLNGISVIINSGGDIKSFFEKRAESLLLEYRLEREKSIKTAETFMDIYISIVIATPMILLLLLVMISVSGIGSGFSLNELTFAIIAVVAMVNIVFLTFLHIKQPVY